MDTKITVEEWINEIEKAQQAQPQQEGITIREISEAISKDVNTTRRIVEKLIRSGRVKAMPVLRTSVLNNVTRHVPGFKLVKKK